MQKNTAAHTRQTPQTSRARLEHVTGPLQRLLGEVHEQVFKYASSTNALAND